MTTGVLEGLREVGERVALAHVKEPGSRLLNTKKWFKVTVLRPEILNHSYTRFHQVWATAYGAHWLLVDDHTEVTELMELQHARSAVDVRYEGGQVDWQDGEFVGARGGHPVYADDETAAALDMIVECDGTLPSSGWLVQRKAEAEHKRMKAARRTLREPSGVNWLRERAMLILRLKSIEPDALKIHDRLEALYRADRIETHWSDESIYKRALKWWCEDERRVDAMT